MSSTVPGSRQSKRDRADRHLGQFTPSRKQILQTRLTEQKGVGLREEVVTDTTDGVRGMSWMIAHLNWRDYIEECKETSVVFENSVGQRVEGSHANRFMESYSNTQYAKLKDLERGLKSAYGKRLHTALLTLTCSWTDANGNPKPPVDHLHELDSSWDAVRRELSRVLDERLDTRWERLAILEPHESGYLHVHIAVFVEGVVTESMFAPVIEAHVRNCPGAGEQAHDVHDPDTIRVKHVGAERAEDRIGNLGSYLGEYLGTYEGDPLEAPRNQQLANTILWATEKQRWRPSNGAQQYMKRAPSSESQHDWEVMGIRDGEDELHEIDGETSGGVRKVVTTWGPPDTPNG